MQNLISQLNIIFDKEIEVYRSLLDVTLSEFDFLVARNYEVIEKHIKLKEDFFIKISSLEEDRFKIISELETKLNLKIENVSKLINLIEDKNIASNIAQKRSILSILINRIKEANKRNSNFIEHSKYIFSNVVNNFNELIKKGSSLGTYSKKGKIKRAETNDSLMVDKEA